MNVIHINTVKKNVPPKLVLHSFQCKYKGLKIDVVSVPFTYETIVPANDCTR